MKEKILIGSPYNCPGPQYNIKMASYLYRKFHCGDKMILQPYYLHNGISYSGKMTFLFYIESGPWLFDQSLL